MNVHFAKRFSPSFRAKVRSSLELGVTLDRENIANETLTCKDGNTYICLVREATRWVLRLDWEGGEILGFVSR